MSYLSIFYDSFKNKIMHRYIDEQTNRIKTEVINNKFEYYIRDKSNNSDTHDVYGNSVIKKETDYRDGIKSIMSSGIGTYETDLPQDIKFLNKRYGNKNLVADVDNFNICNIDIECSSEGSFPYPDKADYPINAITLKSSKTKQVYTFGLYEYTGNDESVKNYIWCPDETVMLEKFLAFFRKCKFHIMTGWHIIGFDVPYIINRMKKLSIDYTKLSPHGIVNKKRTYEEYTIAGISQLDYMKLYKRFTFSDRESYSLNFISKYELGEGKLEYEGTINNIWKTDWNKFIEYNIQDVLLVDKLDKKLRFIELAISICYESLIPFEQVFATIPMHIGYCLKFLHNKKLVMPTRIESEHKSFPGAYVFNEPGFHKYVLSFDVQSLYPTLIRMFNVGPDTIVRDPKNENKLYKTPISKYKDWESASGTFKDIGGIYYRNDKKSVLAEIVESIFFGRIRDKVKRLICDSIDKGDSDVEMSNKINKDTSEIEELKHEIQEEEGNYNFYNNRQLVKKIQMNCFHENTDILTIDGVKKLKDVQIGDLVYSINKETKDLEIKPVEKIYSYDFNGYLNRIKKRVVDIAVTDEHKMLKVSRKTNKISTILAKDFINNSVNVTPIHNSLSNNYEDFIYLNEYVDMSNYNYYLRYTENDLRYVKKSISHLDVELKQCNSIPNVAFVKNNISNNVIKDLYDCGYEVLVKPKRSNKTMLQKCRIDTNILSKYIGYYIAEGSLYISDEKSFKSSKRGITKKIQIAQNKNINPDFYSEICQCHKEIFNSYFKNAKSINACSDLMFEFIDRNFGSKFQKKLYPMVNKLNKKLVFKTMYNGDGTKGKKLYTIASKNLFLKDDIMKLLLEIGCVPREKIYSEYDDCHRIRWTDTNISLKNKNENYNKERYIGKVYNLTVTDNHTVCVGENGNFMWTGQSLYGALGTPYFPFYNLHNAMAITLSGQTVIRYLTDNTNKYLKMKYKLKNDLSVLLDTDSVDGNTNINTSNGDIKISKLYEKCSSINEYSNGKFIGTLDENVYVDSLNKDNNNIEKNKINYVMKHKIKKKMFKIKVNNKEIICTEDHSIEVRRDGIIQSISPKNIKKTDKIILKVV